MKKLNLLNPFFLFALAVFAFGGWVIYDFQRPRAQQALDAESDEPMPEHVKASATIKGLEMLRAGMSRPEVEEHLKPMLGGLSGEVGPVDLTAEFPVYRVRYRLYPNPSSPVAARVRAGQAITITYDARTVGHPLVGISIAPEGNGAARATAS